MHADLLHPNEFLGAPDLKGRDVTLTIHDVRLEELTMTGGVTETKPVMHFAEMQNRTGTDKKRLVLNKTNRRVIQRLYGDETDDWRGKRITLFPTTREADGKQIRNPHNPGGEAIRVRPQKPGGGRSPSPAQPPTQPQAQAQTHTHQAAVREPGED
jgi:hypothetical protein